MKSLMIDQVADLERQNSVNFFSDRMCQRMNKPWPLTGGLENYPQNSHKLLFKVESLHGALWKILGWHCPSEQDGHPSPSSAPQLWNCNRCLLVFVGLLGTIRMVMMVMMLLLLMMMMLRMYATQLGLSSTPKTKPVEKGIYHGSYGSLAPIYSHCSWSWKCLWWQHAFDISGPLFGCPLIICKGEGSLQTPRSPTPR